MVCSTLKFKYAWVHFFILISCSQFFFLFLKYFILYSRSVWCFLEEKKIEICTLKEEYKNSEVFLKVFLITASKLNEKCEGIYSSVSFAIFSGKDQLKEKIIYYLYLKWQELESLNIFLNRETVHFGYIHEPPLLYDNIKHEILIQIK